MKIIIIGGGIGGLATYHSLHKYMPSASVKVYEAYATSLDSASVVGGGLGVVPNGLRALKAISPASYTYLFAHGYVTQYFTLRNERGRTLGLFGGDGDRVMMTRASLHESLMIDVPDNVVHWSRKVTGVEETTDVARVLFEDGTVEECDLIIGADGVHSICRQQLFGDTYKATYRGLTAISGFITLSSLPPSLQRGLEQDQATMTFSRDGVFGYSPSLSASVSPDEQQIMWWTTYAVNPPPARRPSVSELYSVLNQKTKGWKSPWGDTFQQIIDAAYSLASFDPNGRWSKLLVLPRYEPEILPRWTSAGKRIVLMGDAAHVTSGQGVSLAMEDAHMLGLLIGVYLPSDGNADELTVSNALGNVGSAYEALRLPRVRKILEFGKRQDAGKARISWLRAQLRDFFLWFMCKLPIRWLLRINPTHLYDVDHEVRKYLAMQART